MNGKILVASEGMIYTNGKDYGKVVGLGIYDSPDNWWEITEEEYAEKIKEETDADIATDDDYQDALESLGVDFNA